MDQNIWPGDRVLLFDSRLYKNDVITPPSITMQPCTVVNRYGSWSKIGGQIVHYPELIDVEFDYRPGEISKGHLADLPLKRID